MHKYVLIVLAISAMTGCKDVTEMPAKIEKQVKAEAAKEKGIKTDPVCEMPYDSTWVSQTIYNGDTIHFCSDNCKKAFEARPNKYIKKS